MQGKGQQVASTAGSDSSAPNLKVLRYFLCVAEMHSFSRAAIHLRLAQPALSRHIRNLEEFYGIQLFNRDGRGAHLTDAGMKLKEHVVAVFSELDQAKRKLSLFGDKSGEVALGVSSSIPASFVASLVMAIRQNELVSDVRVIEKYSFELSDLLHAGKIDMALLWLSHAHSYYEVRFTVRENLCFLVPYEELERFGPEIEFRELPNFNLISADLPSTTRAALETVASELGVGLHFSMHIDSIGVLKALVQAKNGYAVLPKSAVTDENQRGTLGAVTIVNPSPTLDLSLVLSRRSSVASPDIVYSVADIIEQEVRGALSEGAWSGKFI